MKKYAQSALLILGVMALGANTMFAQSRNASSKATADINTLVKCNMTPAQAGDDIQLPGSCTELFTSAAAPVDPNGFITIMQKSVKMSNSQSLIVSPSLVTGLYTQTRTKT